MEFKLIPVTGWVTVTLHVAYRPVSSLVHVMVIAAPSELSTAVTIPLASTVTILELLLVHVRVLLSAFSGCTVAYSQKTCPFLTVISVVVRDRDVIGCFT